MVKRKKIGNKTSTVGHVARVEGGWQYAVATAVTALTLWAVYEYAAVRYGVVGLSSLNKSLSTSTLFLLGVVLLLGPLSRLYQVFDPLVKYRKELGVLTFFTGLSHVYLSMFPLARRGPFGFYQGAPWSAYPGLAALFIMFGLFLLSLDWIKKKLSPAAWWKLQSWGARLAFIVITVHMMVLKYGGWGTWLADRGAGSQQGVMSLPPLALLAFVWVIFVIVVRLSELLGAASARRVSLAMSITTALFVAWLFIRPA